MEKIIIVLYGIGIMLLIVVLLTVPLMLLWNWLVPTIFGLKTINIIEAFGMLVMCQILFTSKATSSKD